MAGYSERNVGKGGVAVSAVFLLWHGRDLTVSEDDAKLIGVYRTEDDAKAAMERMRKKPGFAQEPSGFRCERYELNRDHWTEGFVYD